MSFIQDIKQYFFKRRLNNDLNQTRRNLTLMNLEDAKHVGIVYDASDYKTITAVRDFEMKLKHDGKKVNIYAYFNNNDTKLEPYLISNKDLNLFGYPKKNHLFSYAKQEFDILLGIFKDEHSPLNAIFANAKAKLRVGIDFKQNINLFDIIIQSNQLKSNKDIVEKLALFLTNVKTK